MACRLGFGPAGQLRWQGQPVSEQSIGEIQGLIEQAYRNIQQKLACYENMLYVLRDELLDRHELYGAELLQLAITHGLQTVNGSGVQGYQQEEPK